MTIATIYNNTIKHDANRMRIVRHLTKNRFLKSEAMHYRMTVYRLYYNRYLYQKHLQSEGFESTDKMERLYVVLTQLEEATYAMEKSLLPYVVDYRSISLADDVCALEKQDVDGGSAEDAYSNDDVLEAPPELARIHTMQANDVREMLSKLNTVYNLGDSADPYHAQLYELLLRAQTADVQLYNRHRGFFVTREQRPQPSQVVLELLNTLNENVLIEIHDRYISKLKGAARQLSLTLENMKTNDYGRASLESDLDALNKEIEEVRDRDMLHNLSVTDPRGSVDSARKWILKEYVNSIESMVLQGRATLNVTTTPVEMTDTKDLVSDHDHTQSIVQIPVPDPWLHPTVKRVPTILSSNILTDGGPALGGFHMRSLDLVPGSYLVQKAEATTVLHHIRMLDAAFPNAPHHTYAILSVFFLNIQIMYNELFKKEQKNEDVGRIVRERFNIFLDTWIREGTAATASAMNTIFAPLFLMLAKFFGYVAETPEEDKAVGVLVTAYPILTAEDNPLFGIFREVYSKGPAIYHHALAVARDRMYDAMHSMNAFNQESFFKVLEGIYCLIRYTGTVPNAFAMARGFVRLHFLRPSDSLNIVNSIWSQFISVMKGYWTEKSYRSFAQAEGTNVYHVFTALVDAVGLRSLADMSFSGPFVACFRNVASLPYEVGNVLLDLLFVMTQTRIPRDKMHEILTVFKEIDELVGSCNAAKDVWKYIHAELLRDDKDPVRSVQLEGKCNYKPDVMNDVLHKTRIIRLNTTPADRQLLVKHIPWRYELVYSDYRYAYLPRMLKNVFDDACYYFNLYSETQHKILDVLDNIHKYAVNNGTHQGDHAQIYAYLVEKYRDATAISDVTYNPLIVMYYLLQDVIVSTTTTASRYESFMRYAREAEALFKCVKDPERVSGPRTRAVDTMNRVFGAKTNDAISAVRRLVALSPVTEYPELNVYNQRHVLHFAWKYIMKRAEQTDATALRNVIKSVVPYIGPGTSKPNSFVELVTEIVNVIDPTSQITAHHNVLLMAYDYCELKTLYTNTPQKVMVYPMELAYVLRDLEASADANRVFGVYNRYFGGIYGIFHHLATMPISRAHLIENTSKEQTPGAITLSAYKSALLSSWPEALMNDIWTKTQTMKFAQVYNLLSNVTTNHLLFLPSMFTSNDVQLHQILHGINEYAWR
ncbi:hypothetical protein IscW_ISCW002607 [Ixodes scapularis]|uniref:Uncharacterized protein n=1 Tax=Ixodes scapularis TaxID=6945 RepID=B7PCJ6_IXOSC|nr:hypothetical protein IscW_ISCW002607 [Ixodes scapularis]|eukprot:XP_002409924.1 hypothetical protein IscW_ISCW002607 [Ixodes scapularis]